MARLRQHEKTVHRRLRSNNIPLLLHICWRLWQCGRGGWVSTAASIIFKTFQVRRRDVGWLRKALGFQTAFDEGTIGSRYSMCCGRILREGSGKGSFRLPGIRQTAFPKFSCRYFSSFATWVFCRRERRCSCRRYRPCFVYRRVDVRTDHRPRCRICIGSAPARNISEAPPCRSWCREYLRCCRPANFMADLNRLLYTA